MNLAAFAALTLCAAPSQPAVVLEHTPVDVCTVDHTLVLTARIVSHTGRPVFEPAAFVRPHGARDFQRVPMLRAMEPGKVSDTFIAEVPAELTRGHLEYFLEAFDEEGRGPFRQGSPLVPFKVTAMARPPPLSVSALPPPPPVMEADSQATAASATAGAATSTSRTWKTRPTLAGIAVGGVGVAALIGCGVAGGLALKDYEAEKAAAANGDFAGWVAARDATRAKAVAADVLLGVGIAAAATGTALIVWGLARGRSDSPPVALSFGADGRGAAAAFLSGTF